MDATKAILTRRTIRKYTDEQVSREDLDVIIEAGLCAPSASNLQKTRIVAIRDRWVSERLGRCNVAAMDRSKLKHRAVSADQPGIIDDPSIKSGFYGAPTVCAIFAPEGARYGYADAFAVAENMLIQAHALGLGAACVTRGTQTFDNDYGRELMAEWGVGNDWVCRAFVLLGHVDGAYPKVRPRKEGRVVLVES